MKQSIFFILLCALYSCNPSTESKKNSESNALVNNLLASDESEAIVKDSANKMIESYLQSIDSTKQDLHALILDATQLRNYLNDTTHGSIKHVKIMFAHTLGYINGGNMGRNAGYKSGALTVILAGYDDDNNYVYWNRNNVMDNATNCPTDCPPNGLHQIIFFNKNAILSEIRCLYNCIE